MDVRLLSPELVERLAALEWKARIAAEGALAGQHRSPRRGQSVEFAEHKEYAPGDELRHLDWKTYGRSDRLYVKRFEEETELHCLFVVDASESMGYGDNGTDKLGFASVLAAALAHLLVTRRDRAGLLCSTGEAVPLGARPGHLRRITEALVRLTPKGRAGLPQLLRRADALSERRSQIVVFSDLLDEDHDEVMAAARSLRARGHDPIVVQTLHPDERDLPFSETAWYLSDDSDTRVLVDPVAARASYLAELAYLVGAYRAGLARSRIPFAELDSAATPADAVATLVNGALAPARRAG